MIITQKKEFDKITESLGTSRTVYLFGCNSCAEQCQTGGEPEITAMTEALTEKGFDVTGSSIVDETCYCGAGVKTVAEAAEDAQPVLPALDSMFLATVERVGRFFEGCSLCGECVLAYTGAICPHTECPKGLLNGPCGGVDGGMCEVDTENECTWVRIYRRLKAQDRLELMARVAPPKDHSGNTQPRKVLLRQTAEEKKAGCR
jgi:hypothetical protein